MPGIPFGAAQQYVVAKEMQSYEAISMLEFIEVNDELPYPRSVAYRRSDDGGELRVRKNVAELEEIKLSADEAKSYIGALVDSGLFKLQRVYRPAQGTFVLWGVQWRIEVSFDEDASERKIKPFQSEGEGLFPDSYNDLLKALMADQAVFESL